MDKEEIFPEDFENNAPDHFYAIPMPITDNIDIEPSADLKECLKKHPYLTVDFK